MVSPTIFLVSYSSLAISFVHVITNERLSVLPRWKRWPEKKVGDTTTGVFPFALISSLLTLPFSPQVVYTTIFISGGVMTPRDKHKKKGTINEVPSRRGLWPAERNIGSWFTLNCFRGLFPGPNMAAAKNGPDGRPR